MTTITYEYPSAEGDPYYPIPRPENQELFKRYEALADATDGVTFVGRLATYRYYNMDQIVGQALATFRRMDEKRQGAAAADGGRRRIGCLTFVLSAGRCVTFNSARRSYGSAVVIPHGAAVPARSAGTYVNPILDRGFSRSGGDPRPGRLLLCLCDADPARRAMDQHPGRPLGRPHPLGASRRCAARKAGLGAGRPRTSGRRASSSTARPTSCIIRQRPMFATTTSAATRWPSRRQRRPPARSSTWACRCCSASASNISTRWPSTIRSRGKHLLYWGSGFQPIKVQELGADRMSFAPGSEPIDLIWPNGENGAFPRLVEAAWVIRHDDFYYLFYSGDNCCGPDAEYGVMVARSKSATGPFETLEQAKGVPHSLMLFKSERWLAPGHNCIVTDKAGEDWIIYHAIDVNRPRQTPGGRDQQPPDPADRPDRWRDGWPFVGTPSDEPQTRRRRLAREPPADARLRADRGELGRAAARTRRAAVRRRGGCRSRRSSRTARSRHGAELSQPG